ncbi:hypothetical protein LCGC14_1650830 [marine sediment metagenome]|uniref:AP2/ERF domain-containing protein n=1 Tax=marine sediment metagenome TaxID=412755 RepID=A0A0F9KCM6_9ZZZZ
MKLSVSKGCTPESWEYFIMSYITHGLRKHSLYNRWASMVQRCTNKKCIDYPLYGGRGINVYTAWVKNFKLFYNYVMALPDAMEQGYSIDRIDNDGDYEQGNIRWVTNHYQTINQRISKRNISGYVGVDKHGQKYKSRIKVHGDRIYLGLYDTKEEAVEARNKFIIASKLFEYPIQKIR